MRALVIGGTSAIGEGIIKHLSRLGYDIKFTFNSNQDKADTICEQIKTNCTAIKLDLSDSAMVNEFLNKLTEVDTPDVLINVAGITNDALSIGNVSRSLQNLHTINFISPASICSHVSELMIQKRTGSIINISSAAARHPRSGNAAYGSAKIALERYTASLSLEIARFKVRTLCIAPAFVDTPMFQDFAKGKEKEILRSLPLREVLTVEDISNSVAAFVRGDIKTTGATLSLTNGQPAF